MNPSIPLILCVMLMLNTKAYAALSAKEYISAVPNVSPDILYPLTGSTNFGEFIENIIDGSLPKADTLFSEIMNLILPDIRMCTVYIASILGFSILASCIKGSNLKLSGNSGEIAFLVCYFVVSGFVLGILNSAAQIATNASGELAAFIKMTLPAYIGIVSSMGVDFKGAQAVFLVMINVVTTYAGSFMINSFLYMGILTVLSNISLQMHITKLIGIFRQVMFWMLGFILTVFAGFTALSGINAATGATSGIRAVKYTLGHTIPVVGGFLADSAELIFASAKIFKNAFGTGGIIVVFAMCLIPVCKLFVVGFLLKFTAGITEPFCDKRLCDTIYGAGQSVIYIMVALMLMSVMFILAFAILLNI